MAGILDAKSPPKEKSAIIINKTPAKMLMYC